MTIISLHLYNFLLCVFIVCPIYRLTNGTFVFAISLINYFHSGMNHSIENIDIAIVPTIFIAVINIIIAICRSLLHVIWKTIIAIVIDELTNVTAPAAKIVVRKFCYYL